MMLFIAAEAQCEGLAAQQVELEIVAEARASAIERLRIDLKALRMTAAETQVAFDKLTRHIIEGEGSSTREAGTSTSRVNEEVEVEDVDLEVMQARSRKYPELKAMALELKEQLVRKAESLAMSLQERSRLKRLVVENEARASGLLEELERMRQQILEKNAAIQRFEAVARLCVSRLLGFFYLVTFSHFTECFASDFFSQFVRIAMGAGARATIQSRVQSGERRRRSMFEQLRGPNANESAPGSDSSVTRRLSLPQL